MRNHGSIKIRMIMVISMKKKDYREKRNNITFRRKLIFILKHILKNLEKTDIKEDFRFSHNG